METTKKDRIMSRYDDAYDYDRDNRDGYVDIYIQAVEEWRENREKEKATPKEE